MLGSEPEIYFLSHRHSATGYIYIFALGEAQSYAVKMRNEMIAEIESRQPEFVVVADKERLMDPAKNSIPGLFEWWNRYHTNYVRVGVADLLVDHDTTYAFGTNAVAGLGKIHRCALEVFQRTPGPLPEPASGKQEPRTGIKPASNDRLPPADLGTGGGRAAFKPSRLIVGEGPMPNMANPTTANKTLTEATHDQVSIRNAKQVIV